MSAEATGCARGYRGPSWGDADPAILCCRIKGHPGLHKALFAGLGASLEWPDRLASDEVALEPEALEV